MPVVVHSPDPVRPIHVQVRTQVPGGMVVEVVESMSGLPISVFGVRGEALGISAIGYRGERNEDSGPHSDVVQVTAVDGLRTIHLYLTQPGESSGAR